MNHIGRIFLRAPSFVLIGAVRVYQIVLSPVKIALLGPGSRCRFQPSCSQYAVEAFREHGAVKGTWLAGRRLLRCHPWGAFGPDPVPPRKSVCCEGPHPGPLPEGEGARGSRRLIESARTATAGSV